MLTESRRGETARTRLWPAPAQPVSCAHSAHSAMASSRTAPLLRAQRALGYGQLPHSPSPARTGSVFVSAVATHQCLRQSHTAGSPRTGPLIPSAACAAEQALGARLLIASLPHPVAPHRVGPHPSDPVSPRPARPEPAAVQLPCGPTALSPCWGCSPSGCGQDHLFRLPQTLSPHPGHRVCPFLCAFSFFNVPVSISLLLQTGLHSTLWGAFGPQGSLL